jgi:hypothetical protein
MEGNLNRSHEELVESLGPNLTSPELTDERAGRERNVARLRPLREQRQSILLTFDDGRASLSCDHRFSDSEPVRINYSIAAGVQILFEPHKLFQQSAANALGAALRTGDRP